MAHSVEVFLALHRWIIEAQYVLLARGQPQVTTRDYFERMHDQIQKKKVLQSISHHV